MTDAAMFPALLDALASANIGFVAYRYAHGKSEKLYISPALAKSLGYTVDEWMAEPMWSLIPQDQKQSVNTLWERLSRTDQIPIPQAIELTLLHREGTQVRAEVATGRVEVPGGHILVFVVRDISLHKQTQLSLLEADRLALHLVAVA